MKLWQRLWLLFTVIWVVLAGLNAGTIIAFSEGVEREKAIRPIVIGVLVPPVLYLVLWAWAKWKSKSEPDPE